MHSCETRLLDVVNVSRQTWVLSVLSQVMGFLVQATCDSNHVIPAARVVRGASHWRCILFHVL